MIRFLAGRLLVLQFTVLDRETAPPGLHVRLAETGLVLLFAANTVIYGAVTASTFA